MRRKAPNPECDVCGGTGETLQYVYNADSHQYEPTGTADCFCTIDDEDEGDGYRGTDGGSKPIRPIEPEPRNTGGGNSAEYPTISPIKVTDCIPA